MTFNKDTRTCRGYSSNSSGIFTELVRLGKNCRKVRGISPKSSSVLSESHEISPKLFPYPQLVNSSGVFQEQIFSVFSPSKEQILLSI